MDGWIRHLVAARLEVMSLMPLIWRGISLHVIPLIIYVVMHLAHTEIFTLSKQAAMKRFSSRSDDPMQAALTRLWTS